MRRLRRPHLAYLLLRLRFRDDDTELFVFESEKQRQLPHVPFCVLHLCRGPAAW